VSGLLYNVGGFNAQGTEQKGKGVHPVTGAVCAPNGVSGSPAELTQLNHEAINAGKNPHGVRLAGISSTAERPDVLVTRYNLTYILPGRS
jgi:hypothetical protein